MNAREATEWLVENHKIAVVSDYTKEQFPRAAKEGPTDLVRAYLAIGMPLDAMDYGATALVRAVEGKQMETLSVLLDAGAEINQTDNSGDTGLHTAVNWKHREVAELFIARGADLNTTNNKGWSPLTGAINKDQSAFVDLLLEAGADPWYSADKGTSAVHFACRKGNEALLSRLLEIGGDEPLRGEVGEALLLTSIRGKRPISKRLISLGAPVTATTDSGWTLWMIATHFGLAEVADALAGHKAVEGDMSGVQLQEAAKEGNLAAVKKALADGAPVNSGDIWGKTALGHAATNGHLKVVNTLLDAGAEPVPTRALVAVVARKGHNAVVERLMEAGWDPGKANDSSALMQAAYMGNLKLAQRLIEAGVPLDYTYKNLGTALHRAIFKKHQDVLEALLAAGADPDVTDDSGTTPLMSAVSGPLPKMVDALLEAGANATLEGDFNKTALPVNARSKDIGRRVIAAMTWDIYRQELEGGKRDMAFFARVAGRQSATSLQQWVLEGETEIVVGLAAAGLEVDLAQGLASAASVGDLDMVTALLDAGAEIDGRQYQRPLSRAAGKGHEPVVQLLIARGATVDFPGSGMRTPLHGACGGGHISTMELLIDAGAAVTHSLGEPEPIEGAVRSGNVEAIQLLAKHGAPLSGPGRQLIALVVKLAKPDLLGPLVEMGADVDAYNDEGRTPLMVAAAKGKVDLLQQLLSLGADASLTDADGNTARQLAEGNKEITDLLASAGPAGKPEPLPAIEAPELVKAAYRRDLPALQAAALAAKSVDEPTSLGDTALLVSAAQGDLEAVDLLLEMGADAAHKNLSGESIWAVASTNKHEAIADRLLANGAKVDANDMALFMLHRDAWRALLDDGARLRKHLRENPFDPNIPTGGSLALGSAARKGYVVAVDLFLQLGALVDPPQRSGSLATAADHPAVVEILLAAGADPNIGHPYSRPVNRAVQVGNAASIALLLEAGAGVTEEVVISAARGGDVAILKTVLGATKGVDLAAALEAANTTGKTEAAQFLVSAGAQGVAKVDEKLGSELESALSRNNERSILAALEAGASPMATKGVPLVGDRGRSVLSIAADKRWKSWIQPLLDAGVPIDHGDEEQRTALMYGLWVPQIARTLIAAGADVRHRDKYGITPVYMTGYGSGTPARAECLRLLVEAGADVNELTDRDEHALLQMVNQYSWATFSTMLELGAEVHHTRYGGETALHIAAKSGLKQFVAALLEAGADVLAKTDKDHTAADLARHNNHADIVALLAEAGGDPGASERALPAGLLDPKTATAAQLLEGLNTKPLPEDEIAALEAGTDLERVLAQSIRSGNASAFFVALEKALEVSDLADGFKQYVEATLSVASISGAWSLVGIGRAIRTLGTYESVLDVHCHPKNSLFPGLMVGVDGAGNEIWTLAKLLVWSERNGHIVSVPEGGLRRVGSTIATDGSYYDLGDYDARTEFMEMFIYHSARLDIVDLLFLQGALAGKPVAEPDHLIHAAYGWDADKIKRGSPCALFLTKFL